MTAPRHDPLEADISLRREQEWMHGCRIVLDWEQPLHALLPQYRKAAKIIAERPHVWMPPRGKSAPLRNPLEDV
jgi:hypothetical protein